MTLDNASLWANYAQAIAQGAGLPSVPDGFVLNGTNTVANFAVDSKALPTPPTTAQALYETYTLGNTTAHEKFVYDSAGGSYFNDYATYIDNLVPAGAHPPSPTDSAQLKLLTSKRTAAQKQYDADLNAAAAAWTAQSKLLKGRYPTFASFLAQTSWGGTIDGDSNGVAGINSQLATLKSQIYGASYVAIQQAQNTVDTVRTAMVGTTAPLPTEMAVDGGAGTQIVPSYNPGDLQTFSGWVDGAIAAHTKTPVGQQQVHVNIGSGSGQVSMGSNTFYSHTDWSTGFWFFGAHGSSTTSGGSSLVDVSSSAFDLTVGFDAITTLDLGRGPWLDPSLVKGAVAPGMSVPTRLYIAMYPQLEMKMDAASFAAARSASASSSGFSAGIFWVGGSHQQSSSQVAMTATWNSSTNSVSISSNQVTPVIVGMEMTEV